MVNLGYEYGQGQLIITADAEAQQEIQQMIDDSEFPESDQLMHDVFDHLMANSAFRWIDASMTGDLTDAPMIGVLDENEDVLERWAFMNYQLISVQHQLAKDGQAVFVGGK